MSPNSRWPPLSNFSQKTRGSHLEWKPLMVWRTYLVREKETKQEVSITIRIGWKWNWYEKINSCERSARARWTSFWRGIWKIQNVWASQQADEDIVESWSCSNGWTKSQMGCKEVVLHIFNKCLLTFSPIAIGEWAIIVLWS